MSFENGTPYQYNTNTDLDGEINRYLKNDRTFTTKENKKYQINKKERLNLEKILDKNKYNLEKVARETSKNNLLKLQSEIIVSSATTTIRNYINKILKLQSKRLHPSQTLKKKNNNAIFNNSPSEYIDNNNISINQYFNKSAKGKKLKLLLEKNSRISIEEMNNYVNKASSKFDVPVKFIMAIIIGESDVGKNKDPFKVNSKGIGQFLPKTFKGLYSKTIWIGRGKNRRTSQGDVLAYFKRTNKSKYYNNLKNIGLSKLSDRYNPEKSILAIGVYLKYISLVRKLEFPESLAKYNIGPFGTIGSQKHLNHNPVIKREFLKIYGKNARITSERVCYAAEQYYNKYT